MHQRKRSLFLSILFLTAALGSRAQLQVYGTVEDSATRLPVAFVSVAVAGAAGGTVTDIDGRFSLRTDAAANLVFTHVGFKKVVVRVTSGSSLPLQVVISAAGNELDNVVILPGENPAHRIIRLLQDHRKQNDPSRFSSYEYNAYTVAAAGGGQFLWNFTSDSSNGTQGKKTAPLSEKELLKKERDEMLLQRLKDNYIFITESYTRRIYAYPGKTKETVLATKVSGIRSPVFAITSSNFQQFGFYTDYLQLGDKAYVNPLIDGSISMYRFRLLETRLNGTDTSFVISFEPRKGKNFNGLRGMLTVNSNGYAIENVTAKAAEERALIMRYSLQQKYERVNNRWFPLQLNTTIKQTNLRNDSVLIYWDSRTYISNVAFEKNFKASDFSDVKLDYDPRSGKRSSEEWEQYRTDSLDEKEKATYQTYTMLPANMLGSLQKINSLFEILALQGIPYGKVDIPFKYLLSGFNKYESFRLGGGFQTNSLLSKTFSLGAFAGYGIKDKAWKYGGNIKVQLSERTASSFQFSYRRDLEEPGNTEYFIHNGSVFSTQTLRNWYTYRMDSVLQYRADLSTKLKPWFQADAWLMKEQRNPAGYNWQFKNSNTGKTFRSFQNTEMGLGLRFTRGEAFTRVGRAKIAFNPPATQLLLQVAKGTAAFGGELDYTRLALQFNHSFRLKKLGLTSLQIEAGQVFGDVPYPYLFNLKASKYTDGLSLYIMNSFQTAGLYEFAADRTASIFIQHNFGNLLFKPANIHIRPEFVLVQHISFGSLRHPSYQDGIEIKTATKGLYESGLLVKNIYRVSTQFFFFGLGAGIFYRYGTYQLPGTAKNLAFKIGMSLSL